MIEEPGATMPHRRTHNGKGIAGFVCALVGFILVIPFLGLAILIVGVILSHIGHHRGKLDGQKTGLAVAGIVIAWVGIAAHTLLAVLIIFFGEALYTCDNIRDQVMELKSGALQTQAVAIYDYYEVPIDAEYNVLRCYGTAQMNTGETADIVYGISSVGDSTLVGRGLR